MYIPGIFEIDDIDQLNTDMSSIIADKIDSNL